MGGLVLALLALLAIAPACEVPAVSGQVIDRETHAPIAGARVVELWREGRMLSDVPATRLVRTATTDRDGRFALAGEASLRGGGAAAPSYVLVHRSYGLVRAGERDPTQGPLAFELSRGDETARRSLAALCESPPSEEWERAVAAEFCARP